MRLPKTIITKEKIYHKSWRRKKNSFELRREIRLAVPKKITPKSKNQSKPPNLYLKKFEIPDIIFENYKEEETKTLVARG